MITKRFQSGKKSSDDETSKGLPDDISTKDVYNSYNKLLRNSDTQSDIQTENESDDASGTLSVMTFPGEETLFDLNINKLVKKLDAYVPGNTNVKTELLLSIQQAYLGSNGFYDKSAILINGNAGVGKSSLVKHVGHLTSIPVIRCDLGSALESMYISNNINSDFLFESVSSVLYYPILQKHFSAAENKLYQKYLSAMPKDQRNQEMLFMREKDNARFTIVELENAEALVSLSSPDKKNLSALLQAEIVKVIKNPVEIGPHDLTSKHFTYVFSADLNKCLSAKIGFKKERECKLTEAALVDLGYSKALVGSLSNIVDMSDLKAEDFEKHLFRRESHLQKKLKSLNDHYDMRIRLDDSAVKIVAKYLASNGRNLKGIDEVTRKLLAPHYISPKKGAEIVINADMAHDRLYTK
jgi:ATP-dependent protease HslVU (ClpYQ) ATPase subunit